MSVFEFAQSVQDLTGVRRTLREANQTLIPAIDALIAAAVSDGDKGDIVVSGSGSVWSIDSAVLSAAGRALIDDADAAAMRTTLGLGTLATQSGTFSGTSSGTNTGDQTITLTGGVSGSGTGSFAATVVTNANLTGPITSVGNATAVASQTGTGSKFVMDTSPTLVTPVLGTATGTMITLTGVNNGDVLYKSVAPAGSAIVKAWAGYDSAGNLIGSITLQTSTSNVLFTGTNYYCANGFIFTTSGVGRTFAYITGTPWSGAPGSYMHIFGDSTGTNNIGIGAGAFLVRATPGGSTLGGLDSNGSLQAGGYLQVHRTATAVSMTAAATDHLIAVTSTAAARTITLPTAVGVAGKQYIIKDESGGAATNNISLAFTSSQTLDGTGGTQVIINTNYGVKRVYSDGANWFSY